jgi:hypothetical protein
MNNITLTPSETTTNEMVLTGGDLRARELAVALGARILRRPVLKYFMNHEQARQWRLLYDAGFCSAYRNGLQLFSRDPRPLPLVRALEKARESQQVEVAP